MAKVTPGSREKNEVSLTFDPPVTPAKQSQLVCVQLKSVSPISYLLGVTAFPLRNPRSISWLWRLHFYSIGGGDTKLG